MMELLQSLLEYWIITLTALFVIVNPLTTSFMFLSLLPDASRVVKEETAKRACLIATALFVTFALLGGVIFTLFGITLEAFRIAGGLILFGIAMRMIQQGKDEKRPVSSVEGKDHHEGQITNDISVVPLAIPFISGPGSLATVMILTSEAPSLWHLIFVFISIGVTTGACYLAMVNSHYVVRMLGDIGKEIVTRIFGIILCVIAVQFVLNGLIDVYHGLNP